jgi:hypothetical protein
VVAEIFIIQHFLDRMEDTVVVVLECGKELRMELLLQIQVMEQVD